MYRYSQQMRQNPVNLRKCVRILAVLLLIAIVGCAVLGANYLRLTRFEENTRRQLLQRVRACCADSRNLAEKLPSSVQSSTAASLANIRQGIYAMDQLNSAAVALFGEKSRMIPAEALTALYDDMDTYFSVIQINTVSGMEIRELLINHLAALQALLSQ